MGAFAAYFGRISLAGCVAAEGVAKASAEVAEAGAFVTHRVPPPQTLSVQDGGSALERAIRVVEKGFVAFLRKRGYAFVCVGLDVKIWLAFYHADVNGVQITRPRV
jgi:hypothetical protein